MSATNYTERDRQDARRILDSFQYSSPERVAWAMGVEPEYATRVTGQKVVAFGELPPDDVPRAVTVRLPVRAEIEPPWPRRPDPYDDERPSPVPESSDQYEDERTTR